MGESPIVVAQSHLSVQEAGGHRSTSKKSVPSLRFGLQALCTNGTSAPGWDVRMAEAKGSQTESLGALMVLELLFGCRDEIHLEDAGLTKFNHVVSSVLLWRFLAFLLYSG